MFDLITLGEMLIDFVPLEKGLSLQENDGYLRKPGGAPANVAVGVARLGGKVSFLGKFARDFFGDYLLQTLVENQVDVSSTCRTDEAKTGLAFVSLDEQGERDFSFYRDPSADMLYSPEELNLEVFAQTKIFHFGSISLISSPFRDTTLLALDRAKENDVLISFDPNLRPALWPNLKLASQQIKSAMKYTDILKVSAEELAFITGKTDLEQGVREILEYGVKLIFVTLGAEGCFYTNGAVHNYLPTIDVHPEDKTGAGDGFMAGVLYQLSRDDDLSLKTLDKEQLDQIALFGNIAGALTTTAKGAINSLPDLQLVESYLGKS